MALQTSGQISLNDIAGEFGGAQPHGLAEYYGAASGIPGSGQIAFSDFYGASAALDLTVSSNILNMDLYSAFTGAGQDPSGVALFNVTINSGVTVYGSNTEGNNSRLGNYNYDRNYGGSNNGDTASGGAGYPRVPWGSISQRAGASQAAIYIGTNFPDGAGFNITNNGTMQGGAGMGGHGPHGNHGPWHGVFQHCGGGTGGALVTIENVNNATVTLVNNGTAYAAGGGGGGGGWGAGHGRCCPKWGGDGRGYNRNSRGGEGGSHGGNPGASGGDWGNNGGASGQSPGGLGGPAIEIRACSGTSGSVTNNSSGIWNTAVRTTSSWRS